MVLDDVTKIACVGAGVIGHSWASTFARRGYQVRLMDIDQGLIKSVKDKIRSNHKIFINKGLMTPEELEGLLDRIELGTEIDWAVKNADFCIESVMENLDLKKDVFAKMDQAAPEQSILASSTSAQLITEIAKVTNRPENCIITHPLNPPHIIPVVEIVKGELTSDKTVDLSFELLRKVGRKPYICSKEIPGFVLSRLMAAVWREALSLLDKGVASVTDIDTAINSGLGLRFGLMGIFEIYELASAGGMASFIEDFRSIFREMWSDMDQLKDISPELAEKAVAGIKEELGNRSREEFINWRDEKLLELMSIKELI
jgi:carnitine 3-dehydrogenase